MQNIIKKTRSREICPNFFQMSRSAELRSFLKGLEKVVRAVADHKEKELSRKWANSSVRAATEKIGTRAEEVFSDVVVKQASVQVSLIHV